MAVASALIAGATAIGGAVIGSRAAGRSADAVTQASDQQTALAREIYNDQRRLNQPFYQTGVAANNAAAELLGLTSSTPQAQTPQYNQGVLNVPSYNRGGNDAGGYRDSFGIPQQLYKTSAPQGTVTPANEPATTTNALQQTQTTPNALSGSFGYGTPESTGNRQLDALQTSPGYQFRLNEGMNALETGAAARGGLLSGGHIRGATRYAQNYASNEYNNRLNQLNAHRTGGQTAAANNQSAGNALSSTSANALQTAAGAQARAAEQRGSIYSGALGTVGGIIAGQF